MKKARRRGRLGRGPHDAPLRGQNRPDLHRASDQMKAWSSALANEVLDWPQLTQRSFFGFTALYRGKTMFGALPRTRTFQANCIALRFDRASRKTLSRVENDPRLVPFAKDKKRWFLFELSSDADLHDALELLSLAYERAKGRKKTSPPQR